ATGSRRCPTSSPRDSSGCSALRFSRGRAYYTRVVSKLRLFVVRHGETAWSRERRFAGSRDVALEPEGLRQCEAVARALASQVVAAVYASPLERARASAELIAKPHRLPVEIDPAFGEMAFGEWEGLTR